MSNIDTIFSPCLKTTDAFIKCVSHQLMKSECVLILMDIWWVIKPTDVMFTSLLIIRAGSLTSQLNHVML